MGGPVFRRMAADEIPLALDWARAEGWNPGFDDARPFFAADPQGFFLAEIDSAPAAVISVVNHSPDLSFLGLYIGAPEFRGQGIGYGLWTHALSHAGERTVGLDGVPDQQANYRKSGFALAGETYRFEGRLAGDVSGNVRRAAPGDIAQMTLLETRATGYAKPAFLADWLTDTETRRTFVLDRDGVEGFVTIRACGRGHKIGPMVAGNLSDAECLLRAAVAAVGAEETIVDVPDDCPALMAFCQEQGMSVSFNTARMYRGPAPVPGPDQRAVATLELG